jgi:uroporphyrinogen-III synthase
MRVIVTRPALECAKWVDALARSGFDAHALPLIAVGPAPDAEAVRAAWARIASFDAVMFVSGNAVAHFFALKPASALVFTAQAAIKIRAFVPGPGSLDALLQVGVDPACIDAPDAQAGQFDSEALWAVVAHRVVPGFRVLIVRGMGDASMSTDVGDGVGRSWRQRRICGGLPALRAPMDHLRGNIGPIWGWRWLCLALE